MNTVAKPPLTPAQIKEIKDRRRANARKMVGLALACPLCPQVTENVAKSVLKGPARQNRRTLTKTAATNAQALLDSAEWHERLVSWLDDFWSRHGHGPTWSAVKKADVLWPEDCAVITKTAVMQLLPRTRLVDGTRTPYGLKVRREEASA